MRHKHLPASVFVLAILLAACAPTHRAVRIAPVSAAAPQSGLTEAEQVLVARHCPLGMPDTEWNIGPTKIVARDGYVLEHSGRDKIALWVCEHVAREQVTGGVPRRDRFQPDPELPSGGRAELSDYRGSGYDRGHQAPAGNQTRDQRLKDETFYLSNMAPQIGSFNQRIWAALEEHVRQWAISREEIRIITGPMFWDPREEDAATADGLIEYFEIGDNRVAVPTHFFKIVAARNDAGEWEAIAFVMENRSHPTPYDFSRFIRSIDWIEERVGINFLPELGLQDEARVEGTVPAIWPE